MGSPAIIRLCRYIVYCIITLGVAIWRAGGLQPPVKDRDTLMEQSVTRVNEAHRVIVKQVVYNEFMKQIGQLDIVSTLQAWQAAESS